MSTAALQPRRAPLGSVLDTRRMGRVLLIVLAAHAAVLAALTQLSVLPGTQQSATLALRVRVLPAQQAFSAETPMAVATPAQIHAQLLPQRRGDSVDEGRLVSRSAPLLEQLLEQAPIESASARVVDLPAPASSISAGNDSPVVNLPRSILTIGPRLRAPVLIDFPALASEADRYAGEFELLIDDTGGVVRVLAATPELPSLLVDAVRTAFLSASFIPGEIKGRPVRSRIRIEVTFDAHGLLI